MLVKINDLIVRHAHDLPSTVTDKKCIVAGMTVLDMDIIGRTPIQRRSFRGSESHDR